MYHASTWLRGLYLAELELLPGDLDRVFRGENATTEEHMFHEVSGIAGHRVVLGVSFKHRVKTYFRKRSSRVAGEGGAAW